MTSRLLNPSLTQAVRLGAIAAFLLLAAMLRTSEASMVLAWDPSPSADVIGYRVYVGTQRGVYSQTFDVPQHQTWFVYTSSKGGLRYYFAVAAMGADGRVSPLSQEVTGIAQFIRSEIDGTDVPGSSSSPIGSDRNRFALGCVEPAAGHCYAATVLASGPGGVSSLAAAGDGRLLFIEDDRRVRILNESTGAVATALEATTPDMRLTGIALDPAFTQSGAVFVGESRTAPDGTGDLTIVRYRELGGVLGQAAAVVRGVLLPPATRAPFIVNPGSNIFVAVPAESWGTLGPRDRDPYAGHVLGFTTDGRTAPMHASGSPIAALGGPRPSSLAWDAADSHLWVGGPAAMPVPALARIDLRGSDTAVWPRVAEPLPLGFGVASVVVGAATVASPARTLFMISDTGRLYRGTMSDTGSFTSLAEILLDPFGEAIAVAVGPGNELYVAVRPPGGSAGTPAFAVLALVPRFSIP